MKQVIKKIEIELISLNLELYLEVVLLIKIY